MPVDDESRLSLLKEFKNEPTKGAPLLSGDVEEVLAQLIAERRQSARLLAMGLTPTRSAIFVGPPGVGKTLTARWLAAQLKVPLYVLDLTAVMQLLAARGINEVQVEAGATLAGALLRAELVDEVLLYVAPVLLGAEARPLFDGLSIDEMSQRLRLQTVETRRLGDDLRLLLRPERLA